MEIIDALSDNRFFGGLFRDFSTWRSWMVYLKALFGLPISGVKELELFRKCTGLRSQPLGKPRESFVICGRRSGKSFISSIIAVYLACFKDWSKVLSAGERGWIFIVANDKFQSKIIKNYISGILEQSAHFKKLVSKDLVWEIELHNRVNIAVKTCSFRSVRGFTVLCGILEEMAFYRSEDSANPDRELMAAIRPALATIPESLLLGISTPYSRAGVLYEAFKKHYGQEGGPLIWRSETRLMNPTIDEDLIRKAFEDDAIAAKAEWGAEFREDVEAFLPNELIEEVTVPNRFELMKVRSATYHGFLDPSGGRQDSFTLAIAHRNNKIKKVVLDVLREYRPPFRPEHVVEEYSRLLKKYGIEKAHADSYAGEWVTSAFRKHGIIVKPSELSKSELYLNFLPLVANRSVELLNNKRLATQLTNLERRTRSGGKDSIDNFFSGHDDLANACAGAIVMAERRAQTRGPRVRRIS